MEVIVPLLVAVAALLYVYIKRRLRGAITGKAQVRNAPLS